MLAIIILPLLGYFGAKSYSRNLVLMYLVYLVAIIAVRIALIAVNQDDTYTAIQSVIIILEILVIVYIIRLYRVLGKMSDEDKFYLIGPRIMDDPDAEDSSSVNPDDENNQQAPYS